MKALTYRLPIAMPELFSCERLSARLTVKACGLRFLRVRASAPGSQDYDSACDRCPVGEHHARTGTLFSGAQIQTPAPTENTMAAHSEHTDEQKRDAVRRVVIDGKTRTEVGASLGVSGTTIKNWALRFGHEVAGDAIDERAGKPAKKAATKAPPKKAATERVPKATKAAAESDPEVAPPTTRVSRDMDIDALDLGEVIARLLAVPPDAARRHLGTLGTELGAAVLHIADRRARGAVADAAWLLTQAGAA